jgi:hypothetical protein
VFGATADSAEQDLRRRDREVRAVMFAYTECLDPELIGEHGLFDNFANNDGVCLRFAIRTGSDVAERVQAEFDFLRHEFP